MNLFQNPDGANHQARAVLAYLAGFQAIEESWSAEGKTYDARPEFARWHNCREQGYVVMMRSKDHSRQINIAFFEHRNSDSIHAIEWEQLTINPPTIDSMDTKNAVYKDKHAVNYGRADEMAQWIFDRLTTFWTTARPRARHPLAIAAP